VGFLIFIAFLTTPAPPDPFTLSPEKKIETMYPGIDLECRCLVLADQKKRRPKRAD
jgi:uncharacterized protein with gpF-like domain